MKCHFCEKEIEKYNSTFHHLVIDEKHEYDICLDCSHKFVQWQGKNFATLFPTKSMKRRFGQK